MLASRQLATALRVLSPRPFMPQNRILDYFHHNRRDGSNSGGYSSDSETQNERWQERRPSHGHRDERGDEIVHYTRGRGRGNEHAQSSPRDMRRGLAQSTLEIITTGLLRFDDTDISIFDACLASAQATELFTDNDHLLSNWEELSLKAAEGRVEPTPTNFGIFNRTTLSAAREMRAKYPDTSNRIGILNFASATKPGGGFLSGAEAQEESIARSSSLYTSLTSPAALPFYNLHSSNKSDGFYSHTMIYTPGVVVFRDDTGGLIEPYTIDVVTSPAVNAGVVRQRLNFEDTERVIESTMTERMARILFLFQSKGCKHLVLGSFGTGVFQNNISMVAATWAELLALPRSKFFAVFETVEFATLGNQTYEEFRAAFEAKLLGRRIPD